MDNKMLTYKKEQDALITAQFLVDNAILAKNIASEISRKIKGEITGNEGELEGSHFYLKGGNAFNLLLGEEMTGDYDFQLFIPDGLTDEKDICIRNCIKNAIHQLQQNNVVLTPNIANVNELFSAGAVDCRGEAIIGRDLLGKSYGKMIVLRNGNDRVELDDNQIVVDNEILLGDFYLYTNYTIPEFILYRLVYAKQCVVNNEKVILKSEIVDISVPRKGSPEMSMSQEGVITHFRDVGEFHIPGWGYHFYENLNLLQEISFKDSASAHKKKKRRERLEYAIDRLVDVNKGDFYVLLEEEINEPCPEGNNVILGYSGAYVYWLKADLLGNNQSIDNEESAQEICKAIKDNIKLHFKTVYCSVKINDKTDYANALVAVSSDKINDKVIRRIGTISEDIEKCINTSKAYQVLSFKLDKNSTELYTLPIVVMVGEYDIRDSSEVVIKIKGNHLCKRQILGGVYYLLILKEKPSYSYKELVLEKSILYIHRRPLQQLYIKKI